MKTNRAFRKAEVIVSLLVVIYLVATLGCRDKNDRQLSQPSDPLKREYDDTRVIGLAIRSADGKYEASTVSDGKGGVHYRVTRCETRTVVLTTHSEYLETPNDVKAGRFSPNSMKFAAAYHYEHGRKYTWFGVWDLETGKLVRGIQLDGWRSSIPDSVFKEQEVATIIQESTGADSQIEHVLDEEDVHKTWELHSPNGKYGATRISHRDGIHFQVGEVESGQIVFTTHGQYSTANEVKVGSFSANSAKFAAAYHYGHAGNYTWIGVWSLKTGKLIRSVRLDGWNTSIPDSVFKENEES